MKRNNVGRSGLVVGELGLGTLTWGRDTEREDASRMLTSLLDAGGNYVDTSPMYGDGLALAALGSVLESDVDRDDVVIGLHLGLTAREGQIIQDCSRSGLISSLNTSLEQLGTTYVDVIHLAAPSPHVPMEETIDTLAGFVTQGAVRYIGLANHPAWQTARVAQYLADSRLPRLTSVSADYSLLNRTIEREHSAMTRELGLGIFAQAPLAGGVLTGKYRHTIPATSRAATEHLSATVERYLDGDSRKWVEAVAKAADGLARTPADVALSWLLHRPTVACALLGARTGAQFDQLLGLDYSALPEPVDGALSEVTALR